MTRSKQSYRKSIQSLEYEKREHYKKISNAIETQTNLDCIPKWKREIENFDKQIEKLKQRL
jgi:hypothetical protein